MSFYKPAIFAANQADAPRQVGVAVFRKGKLLTTANNHHTKPCGRAGYPTGIGYELCEECQPHNHAEFNAVKDIDVNGANLYIYGHFYACNKCKKAAFKAGVKNIYCRAS